MVTTYNTVSADGFIARKDGSEDFIPDTAWDDFLTVLSGYEVVVMGRKTYEAIQLYPITMIESLESAPIKRLIVSRDEQFTPKANYFKVASLFEIPTAGQDVLITSGPSLNTAALKAGIIDRVILNILPQNIGQGMPVFDDEPKLILLSTQSTPTGGTICTYQVQI